MEVNFLNQKPCIPSWPGVFQFDILFNVVLSKSKVAAAAGKWSPVQEGSCWCLLKGD